MNQSTKRGVFTSLEKGEVRGNSPKREKIINSQYTLGGDHIIVNRLPAHDNLTV
jgi:hypothetical protein